MFSEENLFNAVKKALEKARQDNPKIAESYHVSRLWTPIIKSLVENILLEAEPLLYREREYYRVDSMFLEDRKTPEEKEANGIIRVEGKEFWVYKRKIVYAIEYENNKKSWADEADKLSHLRAGMKVILAYSETGKKPSDYLQILKAKLSAVRSMIEEGQSEALTDRWLLCFLPSEALDLHRFVAFKMAQKQFVQILNS